MPKSRTHYWVPKIAATKQRDDRNQSLLQEAGWQTLILWECEIRSGGAGLRERILDFLGPPRHQSPVKADR